MKSVIKKYWNLWGGVILATILAWFYDFEKVKMDTFTSYIVLVLTFIGVLTFFKSLIDKKLKKIEKVAIKSTPLKAMEIAINPTQSGEEIAQSIDETIKMIKGSKNMKKIKNFFVRIWGNKVTLSNILVNLVAIASANYVVFSDLLSSFVFFNEHQIVFKCVVPLLSVLWTILDIYASVNKRGWENLDELKDLSERKKIEKLSQLTKEQKKLIKDNITLLQTRLDALIEKFKKYGKTIENFNSLQKLGIQTQALTTSYQEAVNYINGHSEEKRSLEEQINQLKDKLK